jgi:hypothetical protein
MFLSLILDLSPNYICGHFVSYTSDKVTITPHLNSPKIPSQHGRLFKHFTRRYSLQYLHHFRWRVFWWHLKKYVHMVPHYLHDVYPEPILLCCPPKHFFCVLSNLTYQDVFSIIRYSNQMVLDIKYSMLCPSYTHDTAMQEKALTTQASLPRLMASRFTPTGKLAGI